MGLTTNTASERNISLLIIMNPNQFMISGYHMKAAGGRRQQVLTPYTTIVSWMYLGGDSYSKCTPQYHWQQLHTTVASQRMSWEPTSLLDLSCSEVKMANLETNHLWSPVFSSWQAYTQMTKPIYGLLTLKEGLIMTKNKWLVVQ